MKGYLKDKDQGSLKFTPDLSDGAIGVTKLGKLVAKNANRSRKKGARQEAKKDIKNQLDQNLSED